MKKLEIILNQSIDEDFSRLCELANVGQHFTKTSGVMGKGNTVPKMGDDTWPQTNIKYMMVIENSELEKIRDIITYLRGKFPDEGIACFVTECEAI